jgi:L-fuconolactonase
VSVTLPSTNDVDDELHHISDSNADCILDPSLPIIDPHHHIWDTAHGQYNYLLSELIEDLSSGHNVVKTIYCECSSKHYVDGPEELRPVGETEFVVDTINHDMAASTGICAGLVMYADLRLGARVEAVLDAHRSLADGRLKGIRNLAAFDPSPRIRSHFPYAGLLVDPSFQEGVACLGRQGLVFETFVFHPQLAEVGALAKAHPQCTIILNAFGGPLGVGPYRGRLDEVFVQWRQAMMELGRQPNVLVQIGAFGSKKFGLSFHREPNPSRQDVVDRWRPYYEVCLEAFGTSRSMLTSNFPEDRSSVSYREMWNILKLMAKDLSKEERMDLFYRTAAQTYGLS